MGEWFIIGGADVKSKVRDGGIDAGSDGVAVLPAGGDGGDGSCAEPDAGGECADAAEVRGKHAGGEVGGESDEGD